MPVETEIKLAFPNRAAAMAALRRLGFRRQGAREREVNQLFDDERESLRRAGRVLRLRRRGTGTRARWLLTTKGEVAGKEAGMGAGGGADRGAAGRYKRRAEAECEISSSIARALPRLLALLGYSPRLQYARWRTIYHDVEMGDRGEAALDETPIGVFLELEGPRAWIDRRARELGFSPRDFITASYADLHRAGGGGGEARHPRRD